MGHVSRICPACNGTGSLLIARSMFTADGYSRYPCWFCKADGKALFTPPADFVAYQQRARAA